MTTALARLIWPTEMDSMISTIAVIAPGAMGAAVGRRLSEHGARLATFADRPKPCNCPSGRGGEDDRVR